MSDADDLFPAFCIGQHETDRVLPITTQIVQRAHESNYDMLTYPVTTSHFHTRVLSVLSSHLATLDKPTLDASGTMGTTQNTKFPVIPPLSTADTHLSPNEAMSQLVGVTSSWIDLCSPDPLIADLSRQVLMMEVAYAAFCGLGYLLIPGPKLHHGGMHSDGVAYYARVIQDALATGPYIHFHIWLKMVDNVDLEVDQMGDLAPLARKEFLLDADNNEQSPKIDPFGTWDAWDVIRRTCKYHSRLVVALCLPKHLPQPSVQSRWHSEPVRLLTVDAGTFIKNQKGYPVLSKGHQSLISRLMRLRTPPWIILCDIGPIPGVEGSEDAEGDRGAATAEFPSLAQAVSSNKKHHDPTPHLSYMRNLQQKQPPRTAIERFGVGYQDYLQAPLQPLTVNLESITYEVFEKDPIKYEWYERAVAQALTDWAAQKKPTSNPDGRVVVAVVGAGRGPLVTRALRASAQTGVAIDIWVVEKNQNAFVLLQRHNQTIWEGKVNLVHSDMRSWRGPERKQAPNNEEGETTPTTHSTVDILISELLGSFADNELSPECLDGVTHLLHPTHGISIPASYTAHLSPISAPKLHADVMSQSVSNPAAPETPYVVMLHAIDFLSTNASTNTSTNPPSDPVPLIQTAWQFAHPNRDIPAPSHHSLSNSHNVRHTRLVFPCPDRGVCHGLAGYFETVLYKNVELSTNPVTMEAKSANMISWFPIYFPLKNPLNVPDNSEVIVTMFRQTDNRKVWYEWMVEVRCGKMRVGISDLHSSIKEGCLM
ncbi:hypothetical protein ASPZODRAFT_138034 [Penicilliopsis zonata CBS 506.65]|uniref:Protein arginine N-methyltransferase n=1 Tax=Penicilliopsis zonata CBS 506.65 TaxID=1073090 RepID=A0A1L9SUN2_9EURO|nr:hypothetical protein ASPZODRAFT_138034 [Penicilliopsis zonata CBS 506.65]OJJ50908.1 hypothetical protein ASPZODRAFT_138034 [Penicilliopsis zonata CBS 506.65]